MSEAPERIWTSKLGGWIVDGDTPRWETDVEYIRKDLYDALQAEVVQLKEYLSWYGEQSRLARLTHIEAERDALAAEVDRLLGRIKPKGYYENE